MKYPSSWRRVVPCGLKDGQTRMTELTAVFRNSANVPKNPMLLPGIGAQFLCFTAYSLVKISTTPSMQ